MKSFILIGGLLLSLIATADCRAAEAAPVRIGGMQQGAAAVGSSGPPPLPAALPSPGGGVRTPPPGVPAEPVPDKGSATPTDKKQTPPLDLPDLEKRLRETEAIGLFTKIALKNQVDDLVKQFRGYHENSEKITLAELRQRYDMLLLKLLALLQDSDPPLAHTIVASRETLWGMLTDPVQFTTI